MEDHSAKKAAPCTCLVCALRCAVCDAPGTVMLAAPDGVDLGNGTVQTQLARVCGRCGPSRLLLALATSRRQRQLVVADAWSRIEEARGRRAPRDWRPAVRVPARTRAADAARPAPQGIIQKLLGRAARLLSGRPHRRPRQGGTMDQAKR